MSQPRTPQQSLSRQSWRRFWPVLAVLLSAGFTLLRAGPLHGSTAALIITVLFQFYLPGALLLRALRIDRSPHPIIRFVWVLAAAVAFTVSLGAVIRFLAVPIASYLLILHGIMLALALIRPTLPPFEPIPWRFQAHSLPLYLVVMLCCAAVVYVAVERDQYRFSGYEDQTVFVELAEWMAHGTDPIDISSRRIGAIAADVRWDTDGWTYNQAAWVATSGVSAADLIWFRLTPLFVWAVPLTIFALAFELTQRETTAAWATAALTLLGLMTIDSLVYYPTTITFGQFSLYQVNTLRTIATALVTPLALLPLLAYLRTSSRRFLIIGLLAGSAVAFMHPRQIVILLYSIGAAGLLQTLAHPSAKQFRHAAFAAAVLALLVMIPLSQQIRRQTVLRVAAATVAAEQPPPGPSDEDQPAAAPTPTTITPTEAPTGLTIRVIDGMPRVRLIEFDNVPLIHSTYIVDPTFVFYHPLMVLATVLGLIIGVFGWRRGLTAQYLLGATGVSLIMLFVPIVVPIYTRLVTDTLVAGSILGVPFAVILGLTFEGLLDRIGARWRMIGNTLAAFAVIVLLGLLLFEPVPIPASARDQIRASNALQETRDMLPADQQLVDALQANLDPSRVSVFISPNRIANFISESVSRTYITGGRETGNRSYGLTQEFMAETSGSKPWLTQRELDSAHRWQVTHVIVQADSWRLGQMALEPDQFASADTPPGYAVFRFDPLPPLPQLDQLDTDMNQLARQAPGRWVDGHLDLAKPGAPEAWGPIIQRADALPDGEWADLARAFARTMAGDDAGALPLWQMLDQAHADVPIFTQISAETMAVLGQLDDGKALLLSRSDSANVSARVVAARELLTDTFFYLLTPEQLDRVLDVTRADSAAWTLLAEFDRPADIRQRVALLMSAGRYELAEQWIQRLPTAEIRPEDLTTQASIELARGNVDGALAALEPATDADWTAPNRHLHPDWWQNNVAAQTYHLLKGEIARRAGQYPQAEAEFNAAVQAGSTWAAHSFLAQAQREAGDAAGADQARAALEKDWTATNAGSMPQFVSLLTLADTRQLYAMNPQVTVDDGGHAVTVTATFNNAHSAPLAVRTWRLAVLSADGSQTYAQADVQAVFVPGALTRVSTQLALPADLPLLTTATVYLQPRYDNRITFSALTVPVVLNRPGDAQSPPNATPVKARFGDRIELVSTMSSADANGLTLSLYWRATEPIGDPYQVFVHVLDANNHIVAQADSAPVDGRYPTDQWRSNTVIEDSHNLKFPTPLPSGHYKVVVGLYRLSDLQKLPITGTTLPILDDRLSVLDFTVP